MKTISLAVVCILPAHWIRIINRQAVTKGQIREHMLLFEPNFCVGGKVGNKIILYCPRSSQDNCQNHPLWES